MYGTLLASKYTEGLANARTYLVALSCKSGGSWVHNFQELLRNVSGETITSEAGKKLVEKLGNKLVDAHAPFDIEGRAMRTEASLEALKATIDWDGRFHGHGVHLCTCQGECTPRCQETMAHVSFGTVKPIRTADLAETGGQHDAVRARWEELKEDLSHGEKWPFVVTGMSWTIQKSRRHMSPHEHELRNGIAHFSSSYLPVACSAEHVPSLVPGVLQDDFVAKQPHTAWKRNDGGHGRVMLHPFKHPHDNKAQDLAVSIPDSVDTVDELLTRTETRWIFTPSFKRYLRGPRQALLDRSEALPPPLDGLDVGRR